MNIDIAALVKKIGGWATLRNVLVAVLVGVLEYLRQTHTAIPQELLLLLAAFGIQPQTTNKAE